MAEQILFLEIHGDKPSAVYEAFFPRAAPRDCLRITSLDDLRAISAAGEYIFVLHWGVCESPHYVLELVLQHPDLCRFPLFIADAQASPADRDFWREYGVTYTFAADKDAPSAAKALAALIAEERVGESPRAQQAQRLRQFYQLLHTNSFAAAERLVNDWPTAESPNEVLFLRGLLLKTRKEFEESSRLLAGAMRKVTGKASLDAKFLHLLGNVAFKRQDYRQARTFLEAAQKLSPNNPRRHFLLGQLYYETRELPAAIQAYLQVYEFAPSYSGIHGRLVELLYKRATTPAQLDHLVRMFPHISEMKLVGLHKKANLNPDQMMRSRFLLMIAQQLIVYAEQRAMMDDHYGALNLYLRVGKILPSAEVAMQTDILCRCCELHLAAGDLKQATEFADKLHQMGYASERLTRLTERLAAAALKVKVNPAA